MVISGLTAVLLAELVGEIVERVSRGNHRPEDRKFEHGEFVEREGEKDK